mmetsp:Transcript_117130/g.336054  ORF Transcript_117130/g.336054 Transcript_117130/m.336054 type:complete len:405 (-) Transcript_117130:331-1545(-)
MPWRFRVLNDGGAAGGLPARLCAPQRSPVTVDAQPTGSASCAAKCSGSSPATAASRHFGGWLGRRAPPPALHDIEAEHTALLWPSSVYQCSPVSAFQSCAPLLEMINTSEPSSMKRTHRKYSPKPQWSVRRHSPDSTSHNLTASLQQLIARKPSGEKPTEVTASPPSGTTKARKRSPEGTSQSFARPSWATAMTLLPSGDISADQTLMSKPTMVHTHTPVSLSQTLPVRSFAAVKIKEPSGEKVAHQVVPSCLPKVRRHSPDAAHQSFAVPSSEPVSTCWPSSENTAERTPRPWPWNTCLQSPVVVLHNLAVPSCEAVSTNSPSGENTADQITFEWPASARRHSPESTLHTFAVASSDAVTTNVLSGENSAVRAARQCPLKVRTHSPETALQSFTVWSREAVAI